MLVEDLNPSAQIQAAIDQESFSFQKEIDACLDDMRAKNLMHSSITLEKLTAICQQSYYDRLLRAWQVLAEASAKLEYGEDLVDQFMRYLENHTPEMYDDMQEIMVLANSIAEPGEPALKNLEAAICQGRFMAFRRIRPMIQRHVENLNPANEQARQAPEPVAPLAADPCPDGDTVDLESFDLRDELRSTLFAMEFAISSLKDVEQKPAILLQVRTIRSIIDQSCLAFKDFDELLQAAAHLIKPIAGLHETYADLKTIVAGVGVELP